MTEAEFYEALPAVFSYFINQIVANSAGGFEVYTRLLSSSGFNDDLYIHGCLFINNEELSEIVDHLSPYIIFDHPLPEDTSILSNQLFEEKFISYKNSDHCFDAWRLLDQWWRWWLENEWDII